MFVLNKLSGDSPSSFGGDCDLDTGRRWLAGREGADTQPLSPHQFTLTHRFLGSAMDSLSSRWRGFCTAEQLLCLFPM